MSRWLLLAGLVGIVLRVWDAAEASLWLDELHTLAHADQPSLGAVAASVSRDNHTPLFFWGVHLLGSWEQGAWLRALPLVTSLLVILPLVALSRTLRPDGEAIAALAAWMVACLPYQVHFGAMLRPYAWVGVLSALAAWTAFTERGPRWLRFGVFFACVLLGLWTHRVMALVVFSIGVARLFVRSPGMLGLGWLVLAGTLAVAPSLPWLLGFAQRVTEDRLEFQERVGGYRLRPVLVREVMALPLRVFVPYMGVLQFPWAVLARVAATLFFGGSALALGACTVARLRGRCGAFSPQVRALAVFLVTAFLVITAASLWSWDRVPLQYYTPIAWALPIVVAAAAVRLPTASLRAPLVVLLAASATLLGIAQAGGHCTEDMRRAVAEVRLQAERLRAEGHDPIVTALLSQPAEVFEHRLPYRAYGRDLEADEPEDVPGRGEPGFERPLVILRRDISPNRPEWRALIAGRAKRDWIEIDAYLSVAIFEAQPLATVGEN